MFGNRLKKKENSTAAAKTKYLVLLMPSEMSHSALEPHLLVRSMYVDLLTVAHYLNNINTCLDQRNTTLIFCYYTLKTKALLCTLVAILQHTCSFLQHTPTCSNTLLHIISHIRSQFLLTAYTLK